MNNGRVVKGVNFVNLQDAGDPVEIAAAYDRRRRGRAGISGYHGLLGRPEGQWWIWCAGWRSGCSFPLPSAEASVRWRTSGRILREGADKISVNSAAIDRPELIREAADKFGSQCVVVAIDAKRRPDGSGWNIYKHGGRIDTGIDVLSWTEKIYALGAGEILLTSMDCDGTKAGYDIELTKQVSGLVPIPVIASGGAGSPEHFYDALTEGGAEAALAASLFHYKELSIREVKEYLRGRGVSVRL